MSLSSVAQSMIGCGGSTLRWAATISGATEEWDADDLANGAVTTWTGRSGTARVLTGTNSPVRAIGVKGRGKVNFNGTNQYVQGAAGGLLSCIGALGGDWMVVCVAEALAVSGSNTGTWADTPIWSDNGFRMGQGVRQRTAGPDIYTSDVWVYDGAFKNARIDIGSDERGVHVYHMRRSGTDLYMGMDGTWSAATTIGSISATIGQLTFGLGNALYGNTEIYKWCSKSNGSDEAAAIATLVSEYV